MEVVPAHRVEGKTIFRRGEFVYATFIATVTRPEKAKFQPHLNWENDDADWFAEDNLPAPLHPGVAYTPGVRQ